LFQESSQTSVIFERYFITFFIVVWAQPLKFFPFFVAKWIMEKPMAAGILKKVTL
jgi:hypothetical protein